MGKRGGKKQDQGSTSGPSARKLAKAARKAADALAKQAKRATKAERRAAEAAAKAARKVAKGERAASADGAPTAGEPAPIAPPDREPVSGAGPASEPESAPGSASASVSEPDPGAADEPAVEPVPEPGPEIPAAPDPEFARRPAPADEFARWPAPAGEPVAEAGGTPDSASAPVIVAGTGVSVGASVDVGANSVHLLVAAVGGHRLEPLVDESVFLGLGDRIDAEGYLGSAARGRLVAALVGYADTARRLGATAITFVGTEPMRRAADAATVTHEVERASGVPLHILGHDEEGILTLLGVTVGRPVTHELVVVDVGGGSSEIVVVGPGRAPVAAGVSVGGARLTQRLVRSDPPTQADINALSAEARRLVAAEAPPGRPQELVAVGGTVSNLLKVIPAAALERVLTRRRITVALAMLATEPSALASERHAVNPTRARILPAGAVIVQALLEHYAIERLRVSEDGIREGAILAAAAAGSAWRDRLPSLALGWRHATES